jgi:hypothetical protein
MCGVLNKMKAVAKRDSPDRSKITGLTGDVYRHDTPGPGSNAAFEIGGIYIEASRA